MRKKRLIAGAFCLVLVAFLLVSGAFVTTHAHHDCIGEHCSVCTLISAFESLLRSLAGLLFAFGLLLPSLSAAPAARTGQPHHARSATLVSLKVKFTN